MTAPVKYRHILSRGLHGRCPRCDFGALFNPGFCNLTLRPVCPHCGLNLAKNDSADGPAVLLIFVLGILLVPMALIVDALASPPLWVHGVLWGVLALIITLGCLKPVKSMILAIQYHTNPASWEGEDVRKATAMDRGTDQDVKKER